jgi:hypothetical protein
MLWSIRELNLGHAISSVRDVIAHSENTRTPLCILTLDFNNDFDRISHQYLFQILRWYGISQWFIDRIHTLYEEAKASVQVTGSLAGPMSIQSGVREGCPLSMVLYALCQHPLLRSLEESLPGIQIGRSKKHVPMLAYANDVTFFVSHPAAFAKIHQDVR